MADPRGVFIGWNRPYPGHEVVALGLLDTLSKLLDEAKTAGHIQSFETVILRAHGGDLNGFVLVRGEAGKIDAFLEGEAFQALSVRIHTHIEGLGIIPAHFGDAVKQRMEMYQRALKT